MNLTQLLSQCGIRKANRQKLQYKRLLTRKPYEQVQNMQVESSHTANTVQHRTDTEQGKTRGLNTWGNSSGRHSCQD